MKIVLSNQFKKDLKVCEKRGLNLKELNFVVTNLSHNLRLSQKYRDHNLVGNYLGFRECHIQPDWLLIYAINDDGLELFLFRTGKHSDLFI